MPFTSANRLRNGQHHVICTGYGQKTEGGSYSATENVPKCILDIGTVRGLVSGDNMQLLFHFLRKEGSICAIRFALRWRQAAAHRMRMPQCRAVTLHQMPPLVDPADRHLPRAPLFR